MWILDSFNYDLILVLDWLQQVNPDINWRSLEMTITETHGKHQIQPVDMRQSVKHGTELLNLISTK